MSTKETTDVASQSGGRFKSSSRIPPPGRVRLPRVAKTRSSSLQEVRVKTKATPSGENPSESVPEQETTGVPGPPTLLKNVLREDPVQGEVTEAPGSGDQAVECETGIDPRPSRTYNLTDVTTLCNEIITHRMEDYIADIREYVIQMIAQASDHANAELPDQVNNMMDNIMEAQKLRWEAPNSLTRNALAAFEERVDDTSGRLLLKIDHLEKELEAVRTEIADSKNLQVIDGHPTSDPDSETSKLKRERRRRRCKQRTSRTSTSESSNDDGSHSSSSDSD